MTDYTNEPWYPLYLELKQDEATCRKYEKAGVYQIQIDDIVVYIGKSRDMLVRLAQHIYYVQNWQQHSAHKYFVLFLAKFYGYEITFKPIYYSTSGNPKEIDDEIGFKEGELIRAYLPPLNYQIPKENDYHRYTVNKKAKTISVSEIILGKKNKIDNLNY